MYQGLRKYKHRGLGFKEHVVREHLEGGISKKRLARIYGISPKEISIWAGRYLAGEPLEKKMGRPRTHPVEVDTEPGISPAKLRAENKQLKIELAYKNALIKLLEERARLKKKTDSNSSED
jgi:transposase-like protein